MKTLARLIIGITLKPFLKGYYLKFKRNFRYDRLNLTVYQGVFHPGLFFSSKFFARFIASLELENKRVLDVGCGSGLLSLVAADSGASVTSIDINKKAIANTETNATNNNLVLEVFQSDLFDKVKGTFDYVIVNPPYFPKSPTTPSEFAWYCGEDYVYFHNFFSQLASFVKRESLTYMILSDQCDVTSISNIALKSGFSFCKASEKNFFIERNMIFKISLI